MGTGQMIVLEAAENVKAEGEKGKNVREGPLVSSQLQIRLGSNGMGDERVGGKTGGNVQEGREGEISKKCGYHIHILIRDDGRCDPDYHGRRDLM